MDIHFEYPSFFFQPINTINAIKTLMDMKWAIGKNYYMVKNSLLKRGFKVVGSEWGDNSHRVARCKFDNGGETVELYYTVKPGKTEKLICDKIVDVSQYAYDSAHFCASEPLEELMATDPKIAKLMRSIPEIVGNAVNEAMSELSL